LVGGDGVKEEVRLLDLFYTFICMR
jgi:hypothetical protein